MTRKKVGKRKVARKATAWAIVGKNGVIETCLINKELKAVTELAQYDERIARVLITEITK